MLSFARLDADLETIVWSHRQFEPEIDRQERAAKTSLNPERRERRIPELRNHIATGETALKRWAAEAAIELDGLIGLSSARFLEILWRR